MYSQDRFCLDFIGKIDLGAMVALMYCLPKFYKYRSPSVNSNNVAAHFKRAMATNNTEDFFYKGLTK